MSEFGRPTPELSSGDRLSDVGYTTESLKMLESEEGQLNVVFACYGSASQRAQNFEHGLTKFLLVINQLSDSSIKLEDLESRSRELSRNTMGNLIRQLRKHVSSPDNTFERYFDEALDERNFLMHRWFLERGVKLETQEGRFELLADLARIEAVFERARITINAMRIALCDDVGLDPGDNA